MSKRLFQIVDTQTRQPVEGLYFADQKHAKAMRRELNGTVDGAAPVPGHQLRYIVSPGPDNKHFHG